MSGTKPYLILGYRCASCERLTEDTGETETLYECPDGCGTFTRSYSYTGDNHQCPSCRRFSTKVGDLGCPECQDGELEEADLFKCPVCEELFDGSDEHSFSQHLILHLP